MTDIDDLVRFHLGPNGDTPASTNVASPRSITVSFSAREWATTSFRASIDDGGVTLWSRTEVRSKGAVSINDGPAITLHREEMAALVAIWQEATR